MINYEEELTKVIVPLLRDAGIRDVQTRQRAMISTNYEEELFTTHEGINPDDYILGTFIIRGDTEDYLRTSRAVALEASTGSWAALPLETREVRKEFAAKVINAHEIPDYEYEVPEGKRTWVVHIAYPVQNIGKQLPMLLTAILGHASLLGECKLVDLRFPKSFAEDFAGPQFGLEGLRRHLGVWDRPLLLTILKPCIGLRPEQTAQLFYEAAVGGVDIVKDNELMLNMPYSSIAERVTRCMEMEKRVYEETGKRTYYCVNITGTVDETRENAKAALDAGGNMLMYCPQTGGLNMLRWLVEKMRVNVPMIAHPDFLGVWSYNARSGISSDLVLGKLARLAGADITVALVPYGKFPFNREKFAKIVIACRSAFHGLKAPAVLTGGALTPDMVEPVVRDIGEDVILGAGTAIHGHPMGTSAGARAFRQAIDAVMAGRPLAEAADEHKELGAAAALWGGGEKQRGTFFAAGSLPGGDQEDSR